MRAGKIKIQTLNTWHSQYEFEARLNGIAKRIATNTPDVICLQEIIFYPDGTNTAQWLAEKTGMTLAIAHAQPNTINPEGATIGNAILTRLPVKTTGYTALVTNKNRPMNSSAVWLWSETPNGTPMLIISTHLSWGIANEYQRLQEAIDLNALTKDLVKNVPEALVVMAGTFNTTPESDTIGFLTGRKALMDAENFWVDCWAETNDTLGETQTPRNMWIRIPAEETGTYDVGRIPKRRIDYIFVRDWVYGQTGSPLSSKICFAEPLGVGRVPEAPVSDHYGVECMLLDVPQDY